MKFALLFNTDYRPEIHGPPAEYYEQLLQQIEFAEELHDDATMNIAQFPRSRMKCRNVECVLDDASQVGPPDGEAVHYFFNPFSREVFAEVLNNIVVSYRKRPRRLYLILVDQPEVADLINNSGVFQKHELPLVERMKDEIGKERFADWASILFEQALLAEGGSLEDPGSFVKRLNQLMLELAGAGGRIWVPGKN